MNQTIEVTIPIPTNLTVGDLMDLRDELVSTGFASIDPTVSRIRYEYTIEADDLFHLGVAYAESVAELLQRLGSWGIVVPEDQFIVKDQDVGECDTCTPGLESTT